jgi:hypothetical protein
VLEINYVCVCVFLLHFSGRGKRIRQKQKGEDEKKLEIYVCCLSRFTERIFFFFF